MNELSDTAGTFRADLKLWYQHKGFLFLLLLSVVAAGSLFLNIAFFQEYKSLGVFLVWNILILFGMISAYLIVKYKLGTSSYNRGLYSFAMLNWVILIWCVSFISFNRSDLITEIVTVILFSLIGVVFEMLCMTSRKS